jgi:hypothetical protein
LREHLIFAQRRQAAKFFADHFGGQTLTRA